jgi:replicative DNA helicase
MDEKNFGHLGQTFQMSLLKTIIEDKKFGSTIIDVMESTYFDGPYFRYLMQNIKEMHTLYPNESTGYITLEHKIKSENIKETTYQIHLDTLESIKTHEVENPSKIKDLALNFCKQQVLKKAIKDVEGIMAQGDFDKYKEVESIIQRALSVGVAVDDARDAFFDILDALQADSRKPIPTGVSGIDRLLNGGLSRGEFGVILAPTGVGKTTMITKIGNSGYNDGAHVLQVFFEDNTNNILRKHYCIWTEITPNEQPFRADEVKMKVEAAQERSTGSLKLLKLPSFGTTVSDIKNKIRKMLAEGDKLDLLLIDYVDCISSEGAVYDEEWKGEGAVMRQLESMCDEFNIAIWIATQGNRASIASEVVTTDQMGGSIKKAQIGHVVISIGKTLEQKEHKIATVTLLKSRIGPDGIVFANCTFDNEFLVIDTDIQNTMLGFNEGKQEEKKNRAHDVFKEQLERKKREEDFAAYKLKQSAQDTQ